MNEEESRIWSRFIEEDPFFKTIEYVFNESTSDSLRELNVFGVDRIWCIASDYSIRDKAKENSIITFSAFPQLEGFPLWDHIINQLQPDDYKRMGTINPDFIKYIKSKPVISFCFVHELIDPTIGMTKFKENQKLIIARLKRQYEEAYSENPLPKYKHFLKRINLLNQYVKKKDYNWKLVADVLMVPYIAAYVATKLAEWDNVEQIVWFSDRDSIISLADKFAMMYFHECFRFLHERRKLKNDNLKIFLSEPEEYGRLKRYDGLLRLSDILCGILSVLGLSW